MQAATASLPRRTGELEAPTYLQVWRVLPACTDHASSLGAAPPTSAAGGTMTAMMLELPMGGLTMMSHEM
jgi:hypothetical protein